MNTLLALLLATLFVSLLHFSQQQNVITGTRTFMQNGYELSWSLDQTAKTITFNGKVKLELNGWVGFGLTPFTSMTSSKMVHAAITVVLPPQTPEGQATVAQFFGKDRNTRPDTVDTVYTTLLSYDRDEDTQTTTFSVRRNLSKGDLAQNYDIVDAVSHLIVAVGNNKTTFGIHTNIDAVSLNFYDPSFTVPSMTNADNLVIGNKAVNDNFKLNWILDKSAKKVYITMAAKTKGWVGLGINSAPNMIGATIYVGLQADGKGSLESHYGTKNGFPPAATTTLADFQSAHSNLADGFNYVTFSRSTAGTGNDQDKVIPDAPLGLIWAFASNDSASFGYHHENRGSYSVNFFNPEYQPPTPPSENGKFALLVLHGLCMTLAWAICSSAGIFVARFVKYSIKKFWFHLHIGIFIVSFIAMLAGFIFIFAKMNWTLDFSRSHTLLGMIILVGSFLQPVLGIIANRMYVSKRKAAPVFPDQIHWYVGRGLWVLALFTIYLGLGEASAHVAFYVLYYLLIAFLIALFVFNEKQQRPTENKTEEDERRSLMTDKTTNHNH